MGLERCSVVKKAGILLFQMTWFNSQYHKIPPNHPTSFPGDPAPTSVHIGTLTQGLRSSAHRYL